MLVSNTRITAKNTCDKLHDYMYNQQIEPRQYSVDIRRGVAAHDVLSIYYAGLRDGFTHEQAVANAMAHMAGLFGQADHDDSASVAMLASLGGLLKKYFDFAEKDTGRYKVIAVEKMYHVPLAADVEFGMYLDVVMEHIKGEFRGSVDIWDHKIVYNFMSPEDLRLDGQQPKYIKTARLAGLPIRKAYFNQIRHRVMKDPKPQDLFRRVPLLTSETGIENVWKETVDTAKDINEQDLGIQAVKNRRALNYSACKRCFFQDLCMAELNGEDTTIMRQAQYKPRKSPFRDWMLTSG